MEKRCDGLTDCEDLSDEEQCILVLFDDNYKVENPPMQSDGSGAGHIVRLMLDSYFFKGQLFYRHGQMDLRDRK